ncbi:uncharacterized protein VICG_01541 [Vittaforma corneae ATCC 50505]|uniref:Midasin n=1 Tax=Vittaforma corneae (strain ATCC 50505) TaxID=993615 RepID=L2GKQ7_VITCO|nr:uncharacterized protein VICG_01541 [Vittaforma corneae ATCC 50505]ELA41436.1 hypothetical protein VICG_01541 [Vittaforma corneae ATCC 50505]
MHYILQNRNSNTAIYDAFNLLFFTQLDLSSKASALQLFKTYFKTITENTTFSDIYDLNGYIITPKTRLHFNDVDFAIRANLPILIQGDTSTGKTSMIYALASKYDKRVIRINNHRQTESSDYIGNYTASSEGIYFRPGPLITAMKNGHWIILDELNLASSDVLEVLNRLLDDNKELYIPEIDECVIPHSNFRLFATQNLNYGGRHGLAKSFRNRFIEIFFYEKDENEMAEILERSCKLPRSFIKYIMLIYTSLKAERTLNSFITLRDLFKWAKRQPGDYYELYTIGLEIILERQRNKEDRKRVLEVFNDSFSDRMRFEKRKYYDLYQIDLKNASLNDSIINNSNNSLIFTRSYVKLINLIYKAWINLEPVLLIGETGIGKTRVCEVVSSMLCLNLRSINLYSGIESSDFIGHPYFEKGKIHWMDGPLVKAMNDGDAFLIDEINLAEDSVLERLNSVLEDKRYLFIPEIDKEVYAHSNFRIVATMNPSGDFGKRELSPALRNRFTEIYFELEPDEYYEIFDKFVEKACCITNKNDENSVNLRYFKDRFRMLKDMSVRKIELLCSHIRNILIRNNNVESNQTEDNTVENSKMGRIIELKGFNSVEEIWEDCLELIGHMPSIDRSVNTKVDDKHLFGVHPYYLRIHANTLSDTMYSFNSITSQLNLKRILRGLTTNKGILLEGEPGVGKTSIVHHIAKILSIPILRINLSEQTEMSDLLGSYIPVGDSISFMESHMVEFLKEGRWIILDEINLCTQSVIEGLNSILDHRKKIEVNGKIVYVHSNTRIFGTMNPWNKENGRKKLPKSFLDRFIVIRMSGYTIEDIRTILSGRYGPSYLFDEKLSLRGNIKANELNKNSMTSTNITNECYPISYSFEPKSNYFDISFGSILLNSKNVPQ